MISGRYVCRDDSSLFLDIAFKTFDLKTKFISDDSEKSLSTLPLSNPRMSLSDFKNQSAVFDLKRSPIFFYPKICLKKHTLTTCFEPKKILRPAPPDGKKIRRYQGFSAAREHLDSNVFKRVFCLNTFITCFLDQYHEVPPPKHQKKPPQK